MALVTGNKMALDYNIEPPTWLTRRSEWARDTGTRGVNEWMKGVQFFTDQKKENLNMASMALGIEAQQQALDLNAVMLKNKAEDTTAIPAWLREHSTFESRQNSEWPTAKTREGIQILEQARLRDASSVQRSAAVKAIDSYSKRVDELSELDAEAATEFAQYIGQPVVDPAVRTRLGQSIEAARQAKSELEMQDEPPQVIDIGGGKKIAWKPGSKTIDVVDTDGRATSYPTTGLKAIAEGLDDSDPRKQQIMDMLADEAVDVLSSRKKPPKPSFFKRLSDKANVTTPVTQPQTTESGLRYKILPVK